MWWAVCGRILSEKIHGCFGDYMQEDTNLRMSKFDLRKGKYSYGEKLT